MNRCAGRTCTVTTAGWVRIVFAGTSGFGAADADPGSSRRYSPGGAFAGAIRDDGRGRKTRAAAGLSLASCRAGRDRDTRVTGAGRETRAAEERSLASVRSDRGEGTERPNSLRVIEKSLVAGGTTALGVGAIRTVCQ